MKSASNVHEVIKLDKEFNATVRVIPFGRQVTHSTLGQLLVYPFSSVVIFHIVFIEFHPNISKLFCLIFIYANYKFSSKNQSLKRQYNLTTYKFIYLMIHFSLFVREHLGDARRLSRWRTCATVSICGNTERILNKYRVLSLSRTNVYMFETFETVNQDPT